jgi:Fic family protein
MIAYDEIEISLELREKMNLFISQVNEFRQEGPLDEISVAKLEEYFKATHIYHSTGIEGNRLTLQETALVLKEGIDISGKPLKDAVEVKNLGNAFNYLKSLSENNQAVTEVDIRSLHSLLIGNEPTLSPGEYRKIGVIISGSEHRPPEPLEVPFRMESLLSWINTNLDNNPIIVSTIAHHEIAAIHPFVDGNGRVSRLVMNLILMKKGLPICNIRRTERPTYYEALSFADIGLYESLIELVLSRCTDLFGEYVRIRTETKRMAEWARRWGSKASAVLLRRENREMELWQSRIRQIFLEFQKAAELLDEQLGDIIEITFYDYKNEISFEKYQQLMEQGYIQQANAFSIAFFDPRSNHRERFMFRYFRNRTKFSKQDRVIPLELNYFDENQGGYIRLSDLIWANRIRIRELYFTSEGEFITRYYDITGQQEMEKKGETIAETVQWFYDDILRSLFNIT